MHEKDRIYSFEYKKRNPQIHSCARCVNRPIDFCNIDYKEENDYFISNPQYEVQAQIYDDIMKEKYDNKEFEERFREEIDIQGAHIKCHYCGWYDGAQFYDGDQCFVDDPSWRTFREDLIYGGRVYIFEFQQVYKIGFSTDVQKRRTQLQQSLPDYIQIIGSFPANKNIEQKLHNIFKHKRIRGEWFKLSINDIKKLLSYEWRKNNLGFEERHSFRSLKHEDYAKI